ncbi:hypothetical protein HCN44_011354 [Aphidius gifuensis]|uniref:Alpha-taxilin n=1 Tax=Aphidius gifuensis TaxID=684658 RepID=A0A835CV76_APHGI|nr:alpha-taxilin [Aphidius gifuensis]KAF7994085.1 hypothetical protein HCN44_011354 [Aphidius gifuensis]
MDLENEKNSIDNTNAELRNDLPINNEKLTSTGNGKKNSKSKKKDSAFLYGNEIAVILKSSQTIEQKLATICEKYSEQLHANRKLLTTIKMTEGKVTKMQQENEQCQQQRSKAVLARSRLENLCRELQKLNKAQKEEVDLKLRIEEEKRKEISATFQSAFTEMNTLTAKNAEKNKKMREENAQMKEKIKSVRERIELSEKQFDTVRQQAQLEVQLAEAKTAKLKMEMTSEKENLLKEKQQLLLQLTESQVKIQELGATEVSLRNQISMYTEKYDDFQNALTKSNKVFSGFNEEMAKMSKKILTLEKETSQWKQRWEKSNDALFNMAADKQSKDAELEKLNRKVTTLDELCKAFQRERAELLAQLREFKNKNNDTVATKVIDPVDTIKVDVLSKNCENINGDLLGSEESHVEAVSNDNKTDDNTCKVEETNEKIDDNTQTTDVKIESNTETIDVKIENNTSSVLSSELKSDKNTIETVNSKDVEEEQKVLVVPSAGIIEVVKIDENVELKNKINDNTIESVKDDEESECSSFEVIDKTALDADMSTSQVDESKQVEIAPASLSIDTINNDKVDEVKTTVDSTIDTIKNEKVNEVQTTVDSTIKNDKVDEVNTTVQSGTIDTNKNEKVDEIKTDKQSDKNSNIKKIVDTKETTPDDNKKNTPECQPKKSKDGKRKKKK